MNNLLISALIIIIITSACSNSEKGKTTNNTQNESKKELVRKFIIEDYDFAILENKKFIPYNKAIYHRGDDIYMVLKNVGQFAIGKDSLNNAEMKLEIFDAIGQTVTVRKNLFGERGHTKFDNNILKKPYALYETDNNNKIGKYNFKVTIYDLISGDSTSVNDDFYIE